MIPYDGVMIPSHIITLIDLLKFACTKCELEFGLNQYNALVEHKLNCVPPLPPQKLVDVFKMDETTGVSRLAEEACLHVQKTKMKDNESKGQTCKLISGGPRPTLVSITPVAYKLSTNVSKNTLRKRTLDLKSNLEIIAGPSKESTSLQTGMLLKTFDVEEREKILEVAKVNVNLLC